MANIGMKAVGELINNNEYHFFIPDYQRGYRWEKNQITDLLKDLKEFYMYKSDRNENVAGDEEDKTIYCIQPLVVKKNADNGKYDVIDGQQRLTSLFILLSCLQRDKTEKDKLYSIEYQTRDRSKSFLEDICNKSDNDVKNADYYYMQNAKKTIIEWIDANKTELNIDSFIEMIKKWVKFVWYELEEDDDEPVTVFGRLNIGKIGLTEAELIKALFLNSNNFSSDTTRHEELLTLVEMANEWDQIEYRLQDDRFWLFFHEKEYSKPTRIDYIFDLVRYFSNTDPKKYSDETYPTFSYFYDQFYEAENKNQYLTDCWKDVIRYYRILEEWFNNDLMYHYIGFLCAIDQKSSEVLVRNLMRNYLEGDSKGVRDKEYFMNKVLIPKVKKALKIRDLDYVYEEEGKEKKAAAKPLLLLHNVKTIIDQNKTIVEEARYRVPDFTRFPFHLYKKEEWDIEHIRPNNTEELNGEGKRNERLKYVYIQYQYYMKTDKKDAFYKAYNEYMEVVYSGADFEDEQGAFTSFVNAINMLDNSASELNDKEKNKIWNYVLLDLHTNREYGNHGFAIKRDFIIKKQNGKKPKLGNEPRVIKNRDGSYVITGVDRAPEKETAFVPVCTSNVFSKKYSDYPDNLRNWSSHDAEAYKKDINDKLAEFLK